MNNKILSQTIVLTIMTSCFYVACNSPINTRDWLQTSQSKEVWNFYSSQGYKSQSKHFKDSIGEYLKSNRNISLLYFSRLESGVLRNDTFCNRWFLTDAKCSIKRNEYMKIFNLEDGNKMEATANLLQCHKCNNCDVRNLEYIVWEDAHPKMYILWQAGR